MNVIKTAIPSVLIFEPKVFGDERGFFFESFNHKLFEEAVGYPVTFVQDNHSKSSKGVLIIWLIPALIKLAQLCRCDRGDSIHQADRLTVSLSATSLRFWSTRRQEGLGGTQLRCWD